MANKIIVAALAAGSVFAAAPAQANLPANFLVTAEAPGATGTTATFDYVGVETFNALSNGVQNFATSFGGSPITGTYTGVNVIGSDVYGGAGNAGKYAVAGIGQTSSYSVELSQSSGGVNYFGYWLSALDAGNTVSFYSGGSLLGTFDPSNVLSQLGGNSAYYGNPVTGGNSGEPYVFLNFFNQTGTFDKIVFNQTNIGAGYESDNHTVGWYKTTGGTPVGGAVPEPATWALMILGFGAIGGAMRSSRRKTRTTLAYA